MATISDTPVARLVLASASPARLTLLRSAGIPADVIVSGVDESIVTASQPEMLSGALARLKAQAVVTALHRAEPPALTPDRRTVVLGCDSVFAVGGEILGKPADAADAVRRWHGMRGGSGVLYTGHCLIDAATGVLAEETSSTVVYLSKVTDDEIAAYLATGEPLNVAGGFTIDGLGGIFVERIEGDAGTVIGLSLPVLRTLLRDLEIEITSFWSKTDGDPRPAEMC